MTALERLDGNMWPGLISQGEVFIHQDYVYLPLLLDPEIETELTAQVGNESRSPGGGQDLAGVVLHTEKGYVVKSLALASLVEHYPVVFPQAGEQQRAALRREIMPAGPGLPTSLDVKFKSIIFEVLPHFARMPRSRQHLRDKGAILAYLTARFPGNPGKSPRLEGLKEHYRTLQKVLEGLAKRQAQPGPPPRDWQSGQVLAQWLRQACLARLAAQEQVVWQQKMAEVQEFLELPEALLAVLLSLADREEWEVDGCGCQRDPRYPGDYIIYQRTGEYLLKDYFGRLYLFPDCRVGVATAGPYYPMVLDMYKHPLLRRHDCRQRICLQDYEPATEFSAAGVIRALEEGLSALYYGYNSRKRNGYNSLDEFGRHHSLVAFDDWRIHSDDLRVLRGDLEVKNDFL